MEILYPLVGVICLSLTSALAYQLHSEYSGYVALPRSRRFEPRGEGIRRGVTFPTNIADDFSNARFKERKGVKRYSSPSFIQRDRIDHRRIEPGHLKKKIQNDSREKNLIEKLAVIGHQRQPSHKSDALQPMIRERIDLRKFDVVAPDMFKKSLHNQSNVNHSSDNHNSDRLQGKPIDNQPKDYVRQFIESHRDILQTKTYEKPSYLAVNVHKVQVTNAPLSLNVRWQFPAKMMSDKIHKMQASHRLVIPQSDNPLQGEKNAADREHKRDVRAQGPNQKNMSFREYSKREAQIDRINNDPPNPSFYDSLKRYISFRDKVTEEQKSPILQSAIGIRSDNIEENSPVENPYAIFYKTHQNLDDGFIPVAGGALVSIEEDSMLMKRKNLSANYETKNPNRVLKKFFSLNTNKH